MKPFPFTLRRAGLADLDAVLAIEALAFPVPWTRGMFVETLGQAGTAMVGAEDDGVLVGYALVRVVLEEAEVLTIAVAPSHQRDGIGRQLLDWMIAHARDAAAHALFLDVRAGNHAAQRLYARCGFHVIATRRGYYHTPVEDAVVMRRAL